MPVPLINFPLSSIVDGLISYLKWVFGNPDITPAEYRHNDDERASKIRISAPFVIDSEKPMSAPFLVVERGSFQFQNRILDNLKSASANTNEEKKYVDWADGYVNIICGSRSAGEASSIANWLAIMFQADSHGIKKTLQHPRNLHVVSISPEIPVFKDIEVKRWEVTIQLFVSLQMGWLRTIKDPEEFNKLSIYNTKNPEEASSEKGIVNEGSDELIDGTKNFGHLVSNDPQILQQEFERGWYYIRFFYEGADYELYTVSEIVSGTKLKLTTHDEDGNTVPYYAPSSMTNVEYQLLWNDLHIRVEIPTT